jgi:hypothetical protein
MRANHNDALRYADAEAILGRVFEVGANELPAFRARLRFMRKIGIRLPTPGQGARIEYKWAHLFELTVALKLHAVARPKVVAMLAQSIIRMCPYRGGYLETPSEVDGDMFAILDPLSERPQHVSIFGLSAFHEFLTGTAPDVFAVVNVSECARKLQEAIESHRT